MKKRELLEELLERVEDLEDVVDFLTKIDEEEPDEYISESALVHDAYASRAAHPSVGDTQAFVAGYLARAREEFGVYDA